MSSRKPKAAARKRKSEAAKTKPPSRDDLILARARNALKRITEGPKFSHRPYKPRKRQAPKGRSPADILKEARAARESLVRRGSARSKSPAWEAAAPRAGRADRPPERRAGGRIFGPILNPLGNPPIIATGHGQHDRRPEIWAADDFFVIVEAQPKCVGQFAEQRIGFRYLMVASCFYRLSRRPHADPEPVLIFTLEHSAVLAHTSPGLLARLAGRRAQPIDMVVGMFTPTARIQIGTVDYDEDFTRGRQRLLGLARHHLGVGAHFELVGFFTEGNLLPAMR